MASALPTAPPILSVSELNRVAKVVLEQAFPLLWVGGEISNFTRAASGHWYFSLKDSQAQVRCAMFRHKNQAIDFFPENGMQVEVRALVTLYEARGEFQLAAEFMRRAGLGALYEAFERLKQRLEAEGLFAAERKRAMPAFPRRIGIVTSPTAAALRDVLSTLARRMPALSVIIYPTPVQGEGSAQRIAAALRIAAERSECDLLILCRGGGSIEDLWAFNEEVVARAIAASPIPIVTGVGHETDFTIADFAADLRAPTPTGAAELATPNRADLLRQLATLDKRLRGETIRSLEQRMQHLDYLSRRLLHPGARIGSQEQHLAHLWQRLSKSADRKLADQRWRVQELSQRLAAATPDLPALWVRLENLARHLDSGTAQAMARPVAALDRLRASLAHLNPQSVLERGYSVVRSAKGEIVRGSAQIVVGEDLSISFAHGAASAIVTRKEDA